MSRGRKARTRKNFPDMKPRAEGRDLVMIPLPYGGSGILLWQVRARHSKRALRQVWGSSRMPDLATLWLGGLL